MQLSACASRSQCKLTFEPLTSPHGVWSTYPFYLAAVEKEVARYKTWTLDSGLDYGLDYGLNFGLDWTVASVYSSAV